MFEPIFRPWLTAIAFNRPGQYDSSPGNKYITYNIQYIWAAVSSLAYS